ncbi:MAG: helicase [Deltaproteobacteria bacterium]|nr:MAG: helicase [Deltaproteobacteria bacterium]
MGEVGTWAFSLDHGEPCRVLERERLWGEETVLVWLPGRATTVRVPARRVVPLGEADRWTPPRIAFTAAAARIADALERDVLVAPLECPVIPLPHQILALQRAISGDRVRYLLADEVGLGKTIEAGLILRELKMRGLVRRVLVVAPAGLCHQWVAEMKTHFNETFRLVLPGQFGTWRELLGVDERENLWRFHDQVVCPLDSVKPMDGRRGWTHEQVARYNRERFEDLVTAGWDLIIVDEAHRLAGSTENVARYRLGEALAQAAPYLLLLSATPHQGKTDAFRRLVSFLDPDALPDDESVRRENVAPYVIRTEKRRAIDVDGNPLFKPRRTELVRVQWTAGHEEQKALYEAVTEYVREGYNQAMREKRTAIGFLMILMQRLVTSSTAAIRAALERRLEVLSLPQGQLSLFPEDIGDDWASLDGQEQLESVLRSRLQGLRNERAEVELLLSAGRRCEARGPDVKAEALLEQIRRLQREENNPDLKVLVFTEFVPTQRMLAEFLERRGFRVACLNGSMGLEERRAAEREFAGPAQVLVSTDAGGEGLNLQFCHVVINYDLPWNPMKLEQRIGRVDRIGQKHIVRALNFALEDTVELRVREVLEEKLARILEEFGVDKLADVLDSEEGEVDFDELYVSAVLTPTEAERKAAELAERIRARAKAAREGAKVLGATEVLEPDVAQKVAGHQLPFWTERMTVAYLRSRTGDGARAERKGHGFHLRWPDGTEVTPAVFSWREAESTGAVHLTLEHPKVRGLLAQLPHFAPGGPIAAIEVPGISDKVSGLWSLWRVTLSAAEGRMQRMFPLFVSDEDAVLHPTARVVWDRLIELDGEEVAFVPAWLSGEEARAAYERLRARAEQAGRNVFEELRHRHRSRLERERKKGEQAFEARRRAILRIGLPQVREHRLAELERERRAWEERMAARQGVLPELAAVLVLRVAREGELS